VTEQHSSFVSVASREARLVFLDVIFSHLKVIQ